MRRTITSRQRRLATLIANGNYATKRQALLDSGYSETRARVPKAIIKQKGFMLALHEASVATGNIIQAMVAEVATRDMSKVETKELIDMTHKLSMVQLNIAKSVEAVLPKKQGDTPLDITEFQ